MEKKLEKSKNVLEKRKNCQAKISQLKKTHVYNNCFKLRSRAINESRTKFHEEVKSQAKLMRGSNTCTKIPPREFKQHGWQIAKNSRNRFVDRQSKKYSKKDRPKKFVFSLKADLLYFE